MQRLENRLSGDLAILGSKSYKNVHDGMQMDER